MLGESQNNWVIAMQVNSSSNMISPLDTIIMLLKWGIRREIMLYQFEISPS